MSRTHNGERRVSCIKGIGQTRYPYVNEEKWTLMSHHTWQSIQNRLEIQTENLKLKLTEK